MKVLKVIVDEMPKRCAHCDLSKQTYDFRWYCPAIKKYIQITEPIPDECPLEVETDEPKYKLARGVLNWKEGDESAVDAIRRLRDSEDTFNLLPEAPKEVKGE